MKHKIVLLFLVTSFLIAANPTWAANSNSGILSKPSLTFDNNKNICLGIGSPTKAEIEVESKSKLKRYLPAIIMFGFLVISHLGTPYKSGYNY